MAIYTVINSDKPYRDYAALGFIFWIDDINKKVGNTKNGARQGLSVFSVASPSTQSYNKYF